LHPPAHSEVLVYASGVVSQTALRSGNSFADHRVGTELHTCVVTAGPPSRKLHVPCASQCWCHPRIGTPYV